MSKKLGFELRFVHGGAVHEEERAGFAEAVLMDGVCDELFSGSLCTLNVNRGIGVADEFKLVEEYPHRL